MRKYNKNNSRCFLTNNREVRMHTTKSSSALRQEGFLKFAKNEIIAEIKKSLESQNFILQEQNKN